MVLFQAYAATLKVGNCTDEDGYLTDHAKTLAPSLNKVYSGVGSNRDKYAKAFVNDTEGRCREAQATTAFLWFLFACFAVTVGLSFMNKGKGRGSIV
jgi:hypothetical protein